jgi:two-component system NarL family response regulator
MTTERSAPRQGAAPSVAAQGPRPIRILVADDHLVYRIGIRSLLGSEPGFEVVGEASDGEEAIEIYRSMRPDVLLLDLRMPRKSGIEVVRTLRKEFRDASILIVTSYQTEEEIFQALQAGALGYILKDMGRETLIEAIRQVDAGKRWVSPGVERQLIDRLQSQQLTGREMEVLKLMARGLTNREISNVIQTSVSTVKNHVNSILAKLEVTDRTEAVTSCLTRGILRHEDL